MKIGDFRTQSSYPSAPGVGVVGVFADISGVLNNINSSSATFQVGTQLTGTFSRASITGGSARLATGVVFGGGNSAIATGLANPSLWIPFNLNGATYVIPAYLPA